MGLGEEAISADGDVALDPGGSIQDMSEIDRVLAHKGIASRSTASLM